MVSLEDVNNAQIGALLVTKDGLLAWRKIGPGKSGWEKQRPISEGDGWGSNRPPESGPRVFQNIVRMLSREDARIVTSAGDQRMDKEATPRERHWDYNDPKAPGSPWGGVQTMYDHPSLRGVRWVSTPSHGGLGVADGIARKVLSAPAYRIGEKSNGYVWFEEDVAASIPLFEHPEWYQLLFGKTFTDAEMAANERSVRQSYPRYFKMKEEGYTLPPRLAIGDNLTVVEPVQLSRGDIPAGQNLVVTKLTSDFIYVTPNPPLPGVQSARLPIGWYTGSTWSGTSGDKVLLKKTASADRVALRFAGYPLTEVQIKDDAGGVWVGRAQDISAALIMAGVPRDTREDYMNKVLAGDPWVRKLPQGIMKTLLKRKAVTKFKPVKVPRDPSSPRPMDRGVAHTKLLKAIDAWAKDARADWDPGDSGEGIESVAHDLAQSVLYDDTVRDLIKPSGLSERQVVSIAADYLPG